MNIVTTSELVLREWEPEDELDLIHIAQQAHIQYWLPDWDRPEEWIGRWIVNVRDHYVVDDPRKDFISYAITLRGTGEIIGQISAGADDFDGQKVGIAYFISERHLGRGFTTQAAHAFSDYLFGKYRYDELNSLVQVPNIASNKVMMGAGYARVGVIEKQLDGHPAPKEFVHWRKERTK